MANEKASEKTIEWGGALAEFPEYACLIAQLITEWNVVEFHFVNLLSAMLGAPKPIVSPMVFALHNNRGRLDVMEAALIRLAEGDEVKQLLVALIQEAREVLNIRNTYTHALYVIQRSAKKSQLQMQVFKDYHAGKGQSRRPVSLTDLRNAVYRSERLTGDLFNLFTATVGVLPLAESHEAGLPAHPPSHQVFRHNLLAHQKQKEST